MTISRRFGQPWAHGEAGRVNHAAIAVTSQPAQEPVSLQEAQRFCRIDYDNEDPTLTLIIAACRQRMEGYLRRALITQTITFTLDWGPAWVELPYPPVQSITSVTVRGLDETIQTADPATYFFDQAAGRVQLRPSSVWPVHITPGGWICTYQAGYGTDPSSIPAAIKLAMLNMIAYAFDNRGTQIELAEADKNSLRRYRLEGAAFRIAKGLEPPELLS